ncbi:nitroreductase [Paenibacillus sp. N3/727]|uniref:nitroreductase family protein n=1 Tax=Paenibacillus sp. N3/727 TaxID=2925845 RepID=UPI001F539C48|nr:nitroreductase [Paenibacillus sp. N3/727]UNK18974.1 nitroreductase [Paenibacillus sp. N3/727]
MNVVEAIRTRRSVGKVKQDPVPQESIEQILEAGTWAPNHKHTEPWRFFVMRDGGRELLGNALADIAQSKAGEKTEEEVAALRESAQSKAMRSPIVIGVAVVPSDDPKVIELEEYGAVFAAIQNMLLQAHALGLGAVWRTGDPCFHPLMNEAFGLREKDKMLGFIYLGFPDMDTKSGKREDAASKTVWVNEPIERLNGSNQS